ncbi:DUF4198 domain-containing protein [Thermosulfuriphilus sp.]
MTKGKKLIVLVAIIFWILAEGTASAHFMWLNPRTYTLMPGESLLMTLGWGHSFPGQGGDFLAQDRVEEIYLLGPQGEKISVGAEDLPIIFKTQRPLESSGTWLLVAQRKPGFFTKTVSGYQRRSKEGLKDVIECKYSEGFAKAVIAVGQASGEAYQKIVGQRLEIVPMKDPAQLRPGEYLPVKVLLEGRPLSKHFIYATYAGFSPTGETNFAYTTETNAQGKAFIRVDQRGTWLIMVRYTKPYPETNKCDIYKMVATFTFEVR